MKQMINNWKAIESLRDFITYSKKEKKILIKKPVSGLAESINEEIASGEINAPMIYYVDSDIEQEGDNLPYEIKEGDIVKVVEGRTGIVNFNDGDNLGISSLPQDKKYYSYEFSWDSENNKWVFEERREFSTGGTNLYKHKIVVDYTITHNAGDLYIIEFVNNVPTAYTPQDTSGTSMLQAMRSAIRINKYDGFEYFGSNTTANPVSVVAYDIINFSYQGTNKLGITYFKVDGTTATGGFDTDHYTDTVTPL